VQGHRRKRAGVVRQQIERERRLIDNRLRRDPAEVELQEGLLLEANLQRRMRAEVLVDGTLGNRRVPDAARTALQRHRLLERRLRGFDRRALLAASEHHHRYENDYRGANGLGVQAVLLLRG
jgi:hypothetical protein